MTNYRFYNTHIYRFVTIVKWEMPIVINICYFQLQLGVLGSMRIGVTQTNPARYTPDQVILDHPHTCILHESGKLHRGSDGV